MQEIASGSRTITGVATSIPLFIGMAEQGPMNEATLLLGYAEFERTFGTSNDKGELHDQIRQFFQNGGSQAWVIRVANDAKAAKVMLANEAGSDVLELEARSPGLVGDSIRATVDYDTPNPEATFNLTVEQVSMASGTATVVASETFKALDMSVGSGKYAIDVLEQESSLVRATLDGGAPAEVAAYSLWGVWETVADDNTVLSGALTSGEGTFNISVDGSPMVTVTLDTGSIATTTALATRINSYISAYGKGVSVSQEAVGTRYLWRVTSTGTGGLIRFASSGLANDICVAMQMGASYGGIDVGGSAARRPMVNGLSGVLRADTSAELVSNLDLLLSLSTGSLITGVTVTDVQGTDTASGLTIPAANPGSLLDVRTILDQMVAALNAQLERWTARRESLRLVLTPSFGDASADSSAFLLTENNTTLNSGYFWSSGDAGNVRNYQLGGYGSTQGNYQDGTLAGSDGGDPLDTDYAAAYLVAERDIDIFNMLILPKAGDQGDVDRAVLWGPASVFAKQERAILLMDPPAAWGSSSEVSDLSTGVSSTRVGVVTDHTAIYWPRIVIAKGTTTKTIDPSGTLAGIMARIDGTRGVWKAAAGLEASLYGVRGVEYGMSDADNGVINPEAVNAIRSFPNGIVSWGARTMAGFDNSGEDDYKYLAIRRLALFIQESLYRGLKWAVFEPNDAPLWRQLSASAGAFMNSLFRQGAFAGKKASDAFFVKVDRETTTQNDINLGIVNVVIGFAPLKPAEFVVITLQQKAGEVQV
ncbi:DUF2586 family protein [Pseudenhygromyxa sp. WMMC2535]|uniref:phage tail sheath C-terminal domain-containing protein n=1 Tax=Pseudenhygromyxa sp. WMMC2535 TaxID=2712867 RepID=UPI001C3DB1A9